VYIRIQIIFMKNLVFIFILSIVLMACGEKSQKETVNESKKNLEQGNANTALSFFNGIVGEFVTIQAKFLNITDHFDAGGELADTKTRELALQLLEESERVLNIMNGLTSVGNRGSELKSRANNFFSASKEYAQALIAQNEEDVMGALSKLIEAEDQFISFQDTYASLNNLELQGEIDAKDLQ
jgi:hypothetical protein